ncbi:MULTISPECIES: DUF5133 domain-containing protein [Streptomyces]|uniref:DUF5133 domain-containing protein n=1 Tax=Streptomyces venezuelae TaxID=54571 RepID=A0A5P2BL39_STRVZ|nr:DUF5133 domain-containing protein [Streptomyces venezuelae]MYY86813.1 DUF5133 domain-containing protein [Streptomyces sp. SID335]MYZ16702.1 DUF5133 domain-containing protein [Streptomyces sp. SID337]NDZ90806.1 DUF5133 domain-containing protein [Streptomyces sp. SID10115]NEA01065.1 DUF5133 domain-containing protein [Streptomyces sp. SID10116]NEB46027.1 DUF5133 domain-containing protein [Streptomyces sp. SID339]
MLKPEPRHVRSLLTRYANARIALAEKPVPAWQRELADVTHALCAVTGTRSITSAIAAADEILAAAGRSRAPRRASLAPTDPSLTA